jgi:glycosyltransferase involved in cell wall biosynthesis
LFKGVFDELIQATLMNENKATSAGPTLSVIIPVYNSQGDLEQCLAALAASEYDDFDVLIVDDGSLIPVEPMAERFGYRSIRLESRGGPARARNRGVEQATGRSIVFIDADVCVHPDTLSRMAQAFADDPSIDAVIGAYDEAPADPGFLSQYKNLFHHYIHRNSDGPVPTFWTGCGAIKREVFLSMGGFDEQRYRRPAIEDIELGAWMTLAGRPIVLDHRIKAKHLKRWTLWNLLKTDIFDRGIPWVRLMLRSGEIVSTLNVTRTQRLSVALVYLTLLSLLAALFLPKALSIAIALMLLVTLMNLDFYRFFLRRKGLWFLLQTISMHWLYFVYCGFSTAAGVALYYLRDRRETRDIRK